MIDWPIFVFEPTIVAILYLFYRIHDKVASLERMHRTPDPLMLGDIAFLWEGIQPHGSALEARNHLVRLRYELLKRAVLTGTIKPAWDKTTLALFYMHPYDDGLVPHIPVSLSELRRYAEDIGERPFFLYPRDTAQSGSFM